jgi:general secretion pathway protein F
MRYTIRALDAAGAVTSVDVDAADDRQARTQALALGLTPLSVRRGRASAAERWTALARRGGRFPLVLFSQELLALLDSGISLVEAIETLAEKETRAESRRVLDGVRRALYEGRTLSAAFEAHPGAFPPLYVAAVRASERSSALGEALTRYIAYQTQLEAVRKKIVSASIYPVLLLAVGLLVVLFLLGYVVPRFAGIYDEVGGDLPLLSRWLLALGRVVGEHGWWIAVAALGALVAVAAILARSATRERIGRLLWHIPALGERMRIYQLARFYRTVGMLLRGGTPLVRALDMVRGLLAPALQAALGQAAQRISEGQPASVALETNGLTTPVALRMLRVGERSGRMGEMMERIAAFHDEEMARYVDWFTRLFEPLLMTAIGIVIGVIVVLMYMPIFELAGSLQ